MPNVRCPVCLAAACDCFRPRSVAGSLARHAEAKAEAHARRVAECAGIAERAAEARGAQPAPTTAARDLGRCAFCGAHMGVADGARPVNKRFCSQRCRKAALYRRARPLVVRTCLDCPAPVHGTAHRCPPCRAAFRRLSGRQRARIAHALRRAA